MPTELPPPVGNCGRLCFTVRELATASDTLSSWGQAGADGCRSGRMKRSRYSQFEKTGGDAMRYLRVMMLVSICSLSTPVFADLCCPSGCVPSGYGNACWYTSTNNSCGTGWTCQGPTSRTGGGGVDRGSPAPRSPTSNLALVSASLGQSWSKNV